MFTLLIGKVDQVHTTCGHYDGCTIREEVIDGGYHSIVQALEDNIEILFEELDSPNNYLAIRNDNNVIMAIGHWLLDEILVLGKGQIWSVNKNSKRVKELR